MGHPNGRKPINPQTFSPHTARKRAEKAARKAEKAQRKARRGQQPSRIPWGLIKLLLMTFPIMLALYVIFTR